MTEPGKMTRPSFHPFNVFLLSIHPLTQPLSQPHSPAHILTQLLLLLAVASSDATNMAATIHIHPHNHQVTLNGHKWWISGALDPRCKVAIFMGKLTAMFPTPLTLSYSYLNPYLTLTYLYCNPTLTLTNHISYLTLLYSTLL